jgi:hypothetical protein
MHDLLFTVPGQEYPFDPVVRVRWSDDVYEFWLIADRHLVTADKCLEPTSPQVLDSFLAQLVGGE